MKRGAVATGCALIVASVLPAATASELDAAASVACEPEPGRVVIRYVPSLGDAPAALKAQQPLVFYKLVKLAKDGTTVTGAGSKTYACKLKRDAFTITLKPGVPNVDLLGRCGAEITGLLSITRNGVVVLDEESFENLNCHEREERIESVILRDGAAKPEIVRVKHED
jgi:hypothetical protein